MENLSEFGEILLFLIGGVIFVMGGIITSYLVQPNRPNAEKLTTYECGEDPSGSAWGQFNLRYYVVALIFILFDVELVFLFPWATVFGQKHIIEQTNGMWGWFSLIEMFFFVGILALGLVYAWAKGYLDWVKPTSRRKTFDSPVPEKLYEAINSKYSEGK